MSPSLKAEQELNSIVGYRDQEKGYTVEMGWLLHSVPVRTVNLSQTSLVLTQYAKFMEEPGFELSLDKFESDRRGCGVLSLLKSKVFITNVTYTEQTWSPGS